MKQKDEDLGMFLHRMRQKVEDLVDVKLQGDAVVQN